MAKVKSRETKPELEVRKYLFGRGFRYRKHVKSLPGSPDIVLPKYRTIVLINGCFWHGHAECGAAALPKSNGAYWKNKIEGNVLRDKRNIEKLENTGWKVIVIWECAVNVLLASGTLPEKIKRGIK